jgi:hypothetical protein
MPFELRPASTASIALTNSISMPAPSRPARRPWARAIKCSANPIRGFYLREDSGLVDADQPAAAHDVAGMMAASLRCTRGAVAAFAKITKVAWLTIESPQTLAVAKLPSDIQDAEAVRKEVASRASPRKC